VQDNSFCGILIYKERKMKQIIISILLTVLFSLPVIAQQNSVIWDHYAAGNFTTGVIPKADLDRIILAGIRAPSARNLQPWRFTVVQDQNLANRMLPRMISGNIIIVISAIGDGKTNGVQILDCALATQSINLAAQALGYGSRIYTAHNDTINRDFKSELGLPANHNVVALVRIGRVTSWVDGISGASSRKPAGDIVFYK
jgi:nitroreductase